MKKIGLIFFLIGMAQMAFASTASDSIKTCYNRLDATDATIQELRRSNDDLRSEIVILKDSLFEQSLHIDSIKVELSKTNQSVSALVDSLNINITSTREQIVANSDTINRTIANKSQAGIWIFIVLAIVLAIIAFVFGKLIAKRGNEVASLSAKADKLNEEIVNRLSSEMSEMQTISKQIGSISTATSGGSDTEQKLITTLADRITFMEMTLYKMDNSVRGHKQLSKSIKQMKDNLLANGYELVEMLGKDYHDGMKVTANFIEDENLPEGKQIITGIIKPQINYNGKMIQSAQITVSQNL